MNTEEARAELLRRAGLPARLLHNATVHIQDCRDMDTVPYPRIGWKIFRVSPAPYGAEHYEALAIVDDDSPETAALVDLAAAGNSRADAHGTVPLQHQRWDTDSPRARREQEEEGRRWELSKRRQWEEAGKRG